MTQYKHDKILLQFKIIDDILPCFSPGGNRLGKTDNGYQKHRRFALKDYLAPPRMNKK